MGRSPLIRVHRNFALFVSLLLLVTVAQAQTYIFGRTDLPVGPGAFSVATGDLNGDGVVDLITANQGNDTVSVLIGNLYGGFATPVSYTTGTAPTAVVTGDFNNDGNLDLAVTNGNCAEQSLPNAITELNCSTGTVSVLLGNGDGSFQPHLDYATGRGPAALAAGDFNGDGKLDLAIANGQETTFSILLGNGDGTFQAQAVYQESTLSISGGSQSLVIGDFNNDHKLDVAVGLSVFLGNGDGTFQSPANSSLIFTPNSLAAADFNLDGKLDLYVAGDIYLGNGDGTFVLHATYPATSAPVAATDLNGDGKPDLVVGLGVLLGKGDGTFQTAVPYAAPTSLSQLVVTDVNGDGRLDLAVAESGCSAFSCPATGSATVSLLLGLGDGSFVGGTPYPFQSSYPASQVLMSDFNGDGKLDVVAETAFPPAGDPTPFGIFLGNGDGTLQADQAMSLPQSAGYVAAADLNGDGKADLASVYFNCSNGNTTCTPGDAVVLLSNGDGTFQAPVQYEIGLQPEYVTIADVNGDSKPDLATANAGSNTISVLVNNGDATLQPHVDYATGPGPGTIVAADFNGDGKTDLLVQTETGFSLLPGNGDGTFRTHADTAVASGTNSLIAGDFNGDGKMDVAVMPGETAEILVLLGNGDGTFQAPVMSSSNSISGLLSVGDLNGDGKLDLVLSSQYSGAGSILLGNGDGTFRQPMTDFIGGGFSAVGDLNQDGLPDIASGTGYATSTNNISVLLSTPFKAIAPGSLRFAAQGVGTTSVAQTLTLSNPSNVSFSINNIAATGDFSQTNDCGASLAPAAHCTMTVSFSPTVTGQESGTITLTDTTRISPLAIPLSGSGVNGGSLAAYPERTDFAPQAIGTSSKPAAVMLVNTGNGPFNISGISLAGTDSSDFGQQNNCGAALPAGGSCTVTVTFAPMTAGSRTANIAVSGTEPGSPQSIELAGTGLGPTARLSPGSLTFPSQTVGTTSTAQTATLTNTGNGVLTVTGLAATGDFAETNNCGPSLAAGGSCQISLTFTPAAAGNRTGTLSILGGLQPVALAGTGIAVPDFSVGSGSGSPNSQTITAGQNAQFSVVVTGAGSFAGAVSLSCSIAPAASPAPACSLSSSAVQLSDSGPQTVTVTIKTVAPVTTTSRIEFPPGSSLAWGAMFLGSLWLVPGKQKRRMMMLFVALGVLASATGCGGGGSRTTTTPGTAAGTYAATVTATSGSLSHGTILTVVVQ